MMKLGYSIMEFPGSSASKESACNAGDPGSIPGSGRSAGEGIGYPFQYWASGLDSKESACNVGDLGSIPGLGRSPGGELATHSSILAWRLLMDRGAWLQSMGLQRVGHD